MFAAVAAVAVSSAGCGKKAAVDSNLTTVSIWSGNGHDKAFMDEQIKKWNDSEGKKLGINIDYTVMILDRLRVTQYLLTLMLSAVMRILLNSFLIIRILMN